MRVTHTLPPPPLSLHCYTRYATIIAPRDTVNRPGNKCTPLPHVTAVQPEVVACSCICVIAVAYRSSVQHALSKHCIPLSTYLQMVSLSLFSGGNSRPLKQAWVSSTCISSQTAIAAVAQLFVKHNSAAKHAYTRSCIWLWGGAG